MQVKKGKPSETACFAIYILLNKGNNKIIATCKNKFARYKNYCDEIRPH
jgi:hypothetical protein